MSIFDILERLETGAAVPDAGAAGLSESQQRQLAEVHRLAAELRAALAALETPGPAGPAGDAPPRGPGGGPVQQPRPTTYVVQPGDTLIGIARRFGLPGWRPLYERNVAVVGPNPDLLAVGLVLEIPR